MKKTKETLLGLTVILVLLSLACVIVYFFWQGLNSAVNWIFILMEKISMLETVLIIALITGSITVLGLIVNAIISIYLKASEHRNRQRSEMRIKMEVPYTRFVNMIFDLLINYKNKKFVENELMNIISSFSKEVILYGSNDVVKKWVKYRKLAAKVETKENMKLLEDILFAIRKDLGLKKGGMKTGDLLSLFVNDIEEVLNKK